MRLIRLLLLALLVTPNAYADAPAPARLRLQLSEAPLLGPAWRLAQSEEPKAPGEQKGEEPKKPGEEPKKAEEPGSKKPGDEPTKPTEAKAGDPTTPVVTEKPKPKIQYGIGLQVRAHFVHTWFLKLFLDAATSLNSAAFSGEFVRRKGNFDLVASVDFGMYSPTNGNYLGKGKNPAIDTDYIQFKGLNVLSFNVHFIWHHYFLKWLSLVYGAGVGIGIVFGDILRVSNDSARCTTIEEARDINRCFPKGMDPAKREEWLAQNTGTGKDTPDQPHVYKEEGKWPVIPIVHLLIGLNFKVSDQFSIRVDGGWRDAFYVGATGHYFF